MCVIFWTTSDPNFDLVVASNRDEFLARPTIPAGWHSFSTASNHTGESGPSEQHDEPGGPILSARDASGGGTWLGITQNGSFATLTNFTEATPPLPDHLKAFESRGRLVRDWLEQQARREKQAQQQPPSSEGASSSNTSHGYEAENSRTGTTRRTVQQAASDVTAYLESLAGKLDHFPGFNLLVGTLSQQGGVVGYMTNRTPDGKVCVDRSPDLFLPSQKTSASTTAASAEKPKADQQAEATGRHKTCLNTPSASDSTAAGAAAPAETKENVARGMSNSVLSEPWNKVTTGSALFQAALDRYSINSKDENGQTGQGSLIDGEEGADVATERQQELIESLFDLLWTPPPAPIRERSDLRNSILVTPIPLPSPSAPPSSSTPQSGQGASGQNAQAKHTQDTAGAGGKGTEWYATRTSTVILIPKSNREFGSKGGPAHAVFVERDTYGLDTGARGTESKDGTSAGADTHGSKKVVRINGPVGGSFDDGDTSGDGAKAAAVHSASDSTSTATSVSSSVSDAAQTASRSIPVSKSRSQGQRLFKWHLQ